MDGERRRGREGELEREGYDLALQIYCINNQI